MRVLGIDFTSAPSRKKPITTATCAFQDGIFQIGAFAYLPDFKDFERILDSEGPWVAGLDFPFGQSRTLITNLGWPTTWEGYVGKVADMG